MQDAILTTHEFGIHYLWIDALSIIQDDQEDKTRELSQMPHIYGQATVVIAATRAAEVTEGFLHKRIVAPKESYSLPYLCATGAGGSVVVFDSNDQYDGEPLDKRAWALQERLLASRVLDYGTRQTRWTCRRVRSGRSDGWIPHAVWAAGRVEPLNDNIYYSSLAFPHTQNARSASLWQSWGELISQYTHRELTLQSDRILAISGAAEVYANALGDRYLAGLWESSMPAALGWKISVRLPRPSKYQGPSWSWVSVNGNAEAFIPPSYESIVELKVENAHIHLLSSKSPFGAIEYGALTLNGRIKSAEWKANFPSRDQHLEKGLRLRTLGPDGNYRFLALRMHADALEPDFHDGQWVPVFLILIQTRVSKLESWLHYKGIVLRPRDDGRYSRLGVFASSRDRNLAGTWLPGETKEA
jgi:hypothetical protein